LFIVFHNVQYPPNSTTKLKLNDFIANILKPNLCHYITDTASKVRSVRQTTVMKRS